MKTWTLKVSKDGTPASFEGLMLAGAHITLVEKDEYDKLKKIVDYFQTCHLTPEIKKDLERMLK
jgi:hypothetical protein